MASLKEELSKYGPSCKPVLFGAGYEVTRYKRKKKGDKYVWERWVCEFPNEEAANAAMECIVSAMIIDKITRFHAHQEHIKRYIVPEMWENSVESIKKLGICLNALEPLTDITRVEMAGYLQNKLIPFIQAIHIGKMSRYYEGRNELIKNLREWSENVLQTETTTV